MWQLQLLGVIFLKKTYTVLFDTEIGEKEPNLKACFIKIPLTQQFQCVSCFGVFYELISWTVVLFSQLFSGKKKKHFHYQEGLLLLPGQEGRAEEKWGERGYEPSLSRGGGLNQY